MSKTTQPHTTGRVKFSAIDHLGRAAARRYGNNSAGGPDGDLLLMFLEYANRVIEEINSHPYWIKAGNDQVDYYVALTETRPIPDLIIIDGIVAHHAFQQKSKLADKFEGKFYQNMNRILYNRLHGGNPRHELQKFDG